MADKDKASAEDAAAALAKGKSVFGDTSGFFKEGQDVAFSTENPEDVNLEEIEDGKELDDTEGSEDGGDHNEGDEDGENSGDGGKSSEDGDAEADGDEPSLDSIPTVNAEVAKDLGEYKPENKAVFEKEYIKDGDLNFQRLSAEWWLNAQSAKDMDKGKLHDSTYAFLKEKFGVSDATIKQMEKGMLADTKLALSSASKQFNSIVKSVGGSEAVSSAIAWAKKDGYTKEQRERFNAIRDSGDPDQIQDSLEALMARFAKAGSPVVGQKKQNAASTRKPTKSVTETAPAGKSGGGDVFETMQDYNEAYRQASALRRSNPRAGDAALESAKAKLARSPVFRNRNKGGKR
jgi:hypothetical protein